MSRDARRGVIVAALAVVALIGCGDRDGGTAAPDPPQLEEVDDIPFAERSLRLELAGDGQSGYALVTAIEPHVTRVQITISNGRATQLAHLHNGTCDSIDEVRHPLDRLDHGWSVTHVNASLEHLVDAGLAIAVHASSSRTSEHRLCEQLPRRISES